MRKGFVFSAGIVVLGLTALAIPEANAGVGSARFVDPMSASRGSGTTVGTSSVGAVQGAVQRGDPLTGAAVRDFSTTSRGATPSAGQSYVAGIQSTPKSGVRTATATVTVPAVTCTNPAPQGAAYGVGSEDTLGRPTYLSDVQAMCLGVAQSAYLLDASVCGTGTTSENVAAGDQVSTTVVFNGSVATVTTQDLTTGAVAKAQGSVSACGGSSSAFTTGMFPLFLHGSEDPAKLPILDGSDAACQCQTIDAVVSKPYKQLVRKDGVFTVNPTVAARGVILWWHPVSRIPSCDIHQTDQPVGYEWYSQIWETDGTRTMSGADDLHVKRLCFVREMDPMGDYANAGDPFYLADSETVTLYANYNSLPGAIINMQNVVGSDPSSMGHFHIPLNTLLLWPGVTYWIGVQADMPAGEGQDNGWAWMSTSTQHGLGAVWEWIDGAPGSCYLYWTPLTSCEQYPGSDFEFSLT